MWVYIYYFELLGIVFVEECDGYAHNAIVVAGYVGSLIDIDGIVVVVLGILFGGVVFVEVEHLVAFAGVDIGEPINARNPNHTLAVVARSGDILVVGIEMCRTAFETVAEPHPVLFD